VTDFDCLHDDHDAVTVDAVIQVLMKNADKARALVKSVTPDLGNRETACHVGCHHALDSAIITAPDARDAAMAAKLEIIAGRALKG
jgi:5'-methylthioadenosine phosphorylase